LTYLLPVLFDPSKKLPLLPPKIKYFQEGIEGAKQPFTFHLAIS
jgi:hypothetical protein